MSTTDLYNSYIASCALAAAWELGVIEELRVHGVLATDTFCKARRLDQPSFVGMVSALEYADIAQMRGGSVHPGPAFDPAYEDKGFIHWLVRGTNDLFSRMAELMKLDGRADEFYQRDGAAVSVACKDINAQHYDSTFFSALDQVTYTRVADLGCGSGERLMQMLRRNPLSTGVGIDINSSALEVARTNAKAAELSARVELVQSDATSLGPKDLYAGVDVVTCFLMGHDFWPLESCVRSLASIRSVFPDVQHLVLGDTARTDGLHVKEMPIFTLGFELGHSLMGTYIPTLAEWRRAFDLSGWVLKDLLMMPTPAETFVAVLESR